MVHVSSAPLKPECPSDSDGGRILVLHYNQGKFGLQCPELCVLVLLVDPEYGFRPFQVGEVDRRSPPTYQPNCHGEPVRVE